jgi:hypothetical protein
LEGRSARGKPKRQWRLRDDIEGELHVIMVAAAAPIGVVLVYREIPNLLLGGLI